MSRHEREEERCVVMEQDLGIDLLFYLQRSVGIPGMDGICSNIFY